MTRLILSPRTLQDLERLADFLLATEPNAATETGAILLSGLQILQHHPLVGRIVEHGYRELIISRGHTGYIALYKFDVKKDAALILTIRHQREGGYPNS